MKAKILVYGIILALVILLLPGAAFGWSPYGYAPPWAGYPAGPPAQSRGLRLERNADADNYYLTLHLIGMGPQEVNVGVLGGRWLDIRTDDAAETSQTQVSEDGSGYARSFSYSSRRANRRISLPRDADASAMLRTDAENRIELTIPRRR